MVIDLSPFYGSGSPFEQMLDAFWPGLESGGRGPAYPPLNVSEDEFNVYVRCEVPGLEIDEVDLSLTDTSLVVRGERVCVKGKYYRQERPSGFFQRVVNVQAPIDREAVSASLRDGLLEVILPKTGRARGRKISIEKG